MTSKNSVQIEILKIIIGCILYALSVVLFIDPVKVIPGSVTGVAVVVKALIGFPIGIFSIIINVPLVIWGTLVIGKKLLVYTGLTIVLSSVLIDALAFLPPFTDDIMLASIFGGVLMGIGLALILDGGGTTGGTTVVGRLVVRKKPNIPIGNILLIGDFIIIVVGSVLLQDWDLMLYSLINLYVCVIVINMVMYGPHTKSVSFVYTEKPEVAEMLKKTIKCTIEHMANGRGIICICKKSDIGKLQQCVEKHDPDAHSTSLNASYSFGRGVDF